jgi:peptide/nickel transport system substrate-binding protein
MAFADSPRSLDPHFSGQFSEFMLTQHIYDNLTRIDEKLQAQPQLATRWAAEDNARTWTFFLRQGVKFHHGREFTAEDVVFSFERLLDPQTGSPARTLVPLEKVEALDRYTVRFRLTMPYADLLLILGAQQLRILPADRANLIKTDPSGTGPFRLVEFRPGDRTRMIRFKDYWDQGRPYLDELWQVNIPQHAAQVASLSGGDIQMMWEVPVPYISSLEHRPSVRLEEVKGTWFQTIVMRSDRKPFDDKRVRLAMKYLVDRPALIQAIWQGHASVANDHSVCQSNPFWAPTSPQHSYDVSKAKALLVEAGYAAGLNLELWTSPDRVGLQELAVAFQGMAAPAGVKIEIKTAPWNVYVANVWQKGTFYCDNYSGRVTIDETLYSHFRTNGLFNQGQFSHSEVDKLLDAGRSETNLEKRRQIYARAQQLISDEGYMVIPYHANYVTAMRREVKGFTVSPVKASDFRWTYLEA